MNIKIDSVIGYLKKLDPRYHYYILGGVLVLIFLMNYFLLLSPLLTSISKMGSQTSELKQNIQNVRNDIARIGQNQELLQNIQGQIQEVKIKIRSRQETPLILEDISRSANQYGVKIDQLMPMKDQKVLLAKQKDVEYYALPILIQARSSYHDLGRFLAQLETDRVFYSVGNLSITSNPQDSLRHVVQLTLKAIIFEEIKEGNNQSGARK